MEQRITIRIFCFQQMWWYLPPQTSYLRHCYLDWNLSYKIDNGFPLKPYFWNFFSPKIIYASNAVLELSDTFVEIRDVVGEKDSKRIVGIR